MKILNRTFLATVLPFAFKSLGSRLKNLSPLTRYLPIFHIIYEAAEDLDSEIIVAHSTESLPLAFSIARKTGAKVYCDCVEIPDIDLRTLVPDWHPVNLGLMNAAYAGYLQKCDGILTVGWALAGMIDHYGPPVHVVPNYRYGEDIEFKSGLRKRCGISKDEHLIVAISTIASGLEDVLRAMVGLPKNTHLVIIGKIVPDTYHDEMTGLANELGLRDRLHLLGFVPYDELTNLVSGADVGLIIRDPEIMNNKISLPNRVFDYLFSGVPIVAPDIQDIRQVIETHNVGAATENLKPESWQKCISSVLSNKEALANNAIKASKQLTWEKVEPDFVNALGNPSSVTFIGFKDLATNNRTIRMCKTLMDSGAKVKIVRIGKKKLETAVPSGIEIKQIGGR